jgi:predicted dehydrogenase
MAGSGSASRRQFLAQSLATGAATFAAPAILRAQGLNEKLHVAVVGCGGRGGSNLEQMLGETVVALCDVNRNAVDYASGKVEGAKSFTDYRKMYDELKEGSYDAVVVSTTEHTHAFAMLPALKAKKHVYCEKPLTHNVKEARLIAEAAKAAGVATQMGTQIHAEQNYRRVVELIQGKAIGTISEVHVWVGRAWGLQSPADAKANGDIVSVQNRPEGESPIPAHLDWDLWLGPATYRPFHEVYFPGPKWYRWWDFANGTMSDLGSHMVDLPFWALNLDAPKTIEPFGGPAHPELAPASMHVKYEYAARGDRGPLSLTWYQGVDKPDLWSKGVIPRWDTGMLFVGSSGMVLTDYSRHMILLDQNVKEFHRPAETIPKSLGHHAEWIHACKTGAPTTCNFAYAGPLTEANHLGNVAYRAGKKIEWDAANMKIPNAPEAEKFLTREYRKGWELT